MTKPIIVDDWYVRRILTEFLQAHASEQETGLAVHTCHRTVCQRGETRVTWAFARSRMVCNVQWMSHAEAGIALGASAFARLQNNELF